jgi:hypothetical protein
MAVESKVKIPEGIRSKGHLRSVVSSLNLSSSVVGKGRSRHNVMP